mgnify:FL=1
MKVKDLIDKTKFSKVFREFKKEYNFLFEGVDEKLFKSKLKDTYFEIKTEVPLAKEYDENLKIIPENNNVYGKTNNEQSLSLQFVDWSKWLQYDVEIKNGMSNAKALSNIIYEMTYNGLTYEKHKEVCKEFKKSFVQAIEDINKKEDV